MEAVVRDTNLYSEEGIGLFWLCEVDKNESVCTSKSEKLGSCRENGRYVVSYCDTARQLTDVTRVL